MNDIMKIVKALKDLDILLKGITKTVRNEINEQKGGFFSILFGTFASTLLRNMLAGKGIVRAGNGNKQGDGVVRAMYSFSIKKTLILPRP